MTRTLQEHLPRAMSKESSPRITYEQFLRYDAENRHVEWVDGEIVQMPPISSDHQDLHGFLLSILRSYVNAHDAGAVRHDPFQMKTGADLPGRAPDIIFVARKNLARLKKNHLQGPADIAIEIISAGSRSIDRGAKHYEYERGGVREYWLIDPQRGQVEFYVLGRDRIYRPADISNGTFRSSALKGFWLKVAWLWKRPLRLEMTILRELGL